MALIVLVVDDAAEWRSILSMALSTLPGVRVETAESGEEALLSRADLIISDVQMPGISGLELLQELRKSGRWPALGAVIMSGQDDPELPRLAAGLGAIFFAKPVSPMTIRNHVKQQMEQSHDAT